MVTVHGPASQVAFGERQFGAIVNREREKTGGFQRHKALCGFAEGNTISGHSRCGRQQRRAGFAFKVGVNRIVQEVEETSALLRAGRNGTPHTLMVTLATFTARTLSDVPVDHAMTHLLFCIVVSWKRA